ncbi:MAG: hypothetical protein WDZ80_05885 [Candidatus Paceibacterota bacterium]
MSKINKIFLDPEQDVDSILEEIENSSASTIILNIPDDSILKDDPDNFHSIKEVADEFGKDVAIESTDKSIEEMAEAAKIESVNPIFGKKEKFVSDIIPRGRSKEEDEKKDKAYADFFNHTPKRKQNKKNKEKKKRNFKLSLPSPNNKILLVSGIVILFLGFITVTKILPQATVSVSLAETAINLNNQINISTEVSQSELNNNGNFTFPGEIIKSSKNIEMYFSASGEDEVERYATGEIYIYNEFSSSPQVLVATTRFETPDGKIYRINEAVTIPGADVENGVITPSRIKVSVTADESGDDYNLSPESDHIWTIPGFRESGLMERYEGFYAIPDGDMIGGFIGKTNLPTEEDINTAKTEVRQALLDSLKNEILIIDSPGFKLLEEAIEFEIIEEQVNETVNQDGMFTVFTQGELTVFVFEEDKLKQSLVTSLDPSIDFDFSINEDNIEYSNISVNEEEGIMTFDMTGSLMVEPVLDENSFKAQILGKQEIEIRSVMFSIPKLEKADVSLWPFWVKSIPDRENKVDIVFQ